MPDPTLHGNGVNCPACELRRESIQDDRLRVGRLVIACNFCGGTGRVGRSVEAIIREAVEWAAEHYWPEREKRWSER